MAEGQGGNGSADIAKGAPVENGKAASSAAPTKPAASAKTAATGKATPRKRRRWPWVLLLLVVVLAAVGVGLFHWQKWYRFDDAADIQGEWKARATGDTIVLDARNLKLTDVVSYEYRLNTDEKTITYQFGQLEGGGHYYFSNDRDVLVIVDGDQALDFFSELGFLPEDVLKDDDASDNVTVFDKVSSDTSATPSGTGNGLLSGNASRGEREFVVKEEVSTSSSSGAHKASSSSSAGRSARSSSSSRAAQADVKSGDDEANADVLGESDESGFQAYDDEAGSYDETGYSTYSDEGEYAESYDEGYEGDDGYLADDDYDYEYE